MPVKHSPLPPELVVVDVFRPKIRTRGRNTSRLVAPRVEDVEELTCTRRPVQAQFTCGYAVVIVTDIVMRDNDRRDGLRRTGNDGLVDAVVVIVVKILSQTKLQLQCWIDLPTRLPKYTASALY